MISQKQKGFRKLNKSNIASVLFVIIAILVAMTVFAVLFGVFFFKFFLGSRVRDEYRVMSYMLRIYEETNDTDEAFRQMDREGRSYYLTDSDGNIIYISGTDTRGNEVAALVDPYDGGEYTVYTDADHNFFIVDRGQIHTDWKGVLEWFTLSMHRQLVTNGQDGYIEMPAWLSTSSENGGTKLYTRMFFRIDVTDVEIIAFFLAALGIMLFVTFVLMIVYMCRGISRQRKLNNLFFMDDVTGKRNWMWFQIYGEKIVNRSSNSGINFAVLDIVLVKYRNFCMCHSIEEGEDLLRRVDALITRNLDRKKELCAHYASANFAVLLRYANETELKARIENLIAQLGKLDEVHRLTYHVGVDLMGVRPDSANRPMRRRQVELDREYNNACTARATLEGNDDSGLAFFTKELVDEQKWIDTVREKQQSALDNEEFLVYYQPKYDPQTNELKGAEALIRWDSPEFGFKGPGAFIPIFEQNGFITEIDHYMISHVARDQKRWIEQGLKCVPVSVNISRAHFIEKDLADQIRNMIDAVGTPHDLIELELTESAFFDDKNAIIETIKKLKEYGFKVSMDDFGSGYSSLNSLKDMPLDVLKLDAEFFRGEADDERREIVVSEAIRLAKSLNMRTVAEGVEVEEQAEFLAGQGCDMIQGYIYDKPMNGQQFVDRMISGTGQRGQ